MIEKPRPKESGLQHRSLPEFSEDLDLPERHFSEEQILQR